MERIRELKSTKAKLIEDSRAILDVAEKEKRGLNTEERASHDKIFEDIKGIDDQVDRLERQRELDAQLEDRGTPLSEGSGANPPAQTPEENDELRKLLPNMRDEIRSLPTAQASYNKEFRNFLGNGQITPELRTHQVDVGASGGYITTPVQFVAQLIEAVRQKVFIRQMATVHTGVTAQSLGMPALNASADDGEWTAELGVGGVTSVTFGGRELKPHPLSKMAKIGRKLLRTSVFPIETIVLNELAAILAKTEEKNFITGTGVNQPLGVYTASSSGISTDRDVLCDESTALPTFDGLIDVKYSLDDQYWEKARWLIHKNLQKHLSKIKNSDGVYAWRAGLREGEPDRLLDIPLSRSAYAPSTLTSGDYVAVLGDFSFYHIADSLEMLMQRLEEVFYQTDEVGYSVRKETDGMPVLEEAFVRAKIA